MLYKMYFTNNSRRMHHKSMFRKTNKHKRYKTRCKAWEDFTTWYDAINEM